ncbi:1,4-alpha-glucan branching protein GlgB [Parachlamydia sp. AcF125]|uniref:1,4-alpha-glucan branching protein GlgB n=1 Tax=Parachlamydia sp. AcF125 TaxID=2795736 RepID=UPI001BC9430A|nr:1,4-alpha-glucan branching protein GlgB [Parachlamydia sp. AcF125]MBS4168263.1 1,4-alpha-glucan branching enzyme GlgB [Parachlamydia sp. AcF125]
MDTLISPFTHPQFDSLLAGEAYDPHQFLGLHRLSNDRQVIRVWRPGAKDIHLKIQDQAVSAVQIHQAGLFELTVPNTLHPTDYQVFHQNGLSGGDPYTFAPTIGEVDQYLFSKGVHYKLYQMMGARLIKHQGYKGTRFAVWAPSARSVSVVGDFNHWDGRTNPMRALGDSGIWELFIPGIEEGEKYKFEIRTQAGELKLKADPFALGNELRPATASVIVDVDRFEWQDQQWMEQRVQKKNAPRPFNIYEVHLGSWKTRDGYFLNYRELAVKLADYCREMSYTHVELLPIQEHPLDESWGYQVSGFYAVTSRYGTPEDFQWFVNHLHQHQIGVILDWVPGHFPTDDFSLGSFDGTSLYEHADPRQGLHPHWNTYIFNFGRHEVSNFLIANALFWFDKMHVDGLRVDAVASMLYLDYGREPQEWIPNQYGGKENLEAIEFLKHLNSVVHQFFPGVYTIAEESTAFPAVTYPVAQGGLGFDFKWNMGWMNDTLRYFSKDMIFRSHHHRDLTFGLLYAFTEKFILVLSHDEVVHGKNSLLSKMPGDIWQKFANLRLLFSYTMCQPGKKLFFMGGEIGQWNEWACKGEIEWDLLRYPFHQGMQTLVKELNHFYLSSPELWERDLDFTGFEWVDFSDTQNSVICYLRKSHQGVLLCVHNFTPAYHSDYFIRLPNVSWITECFNTDHEKYGGSGKLNPHPRIHLDARGKREGISFQLAPLSTMIFQVRF